MLGATFLIWQARNGLRPMDLIDLVNLIALLYPGPPGKSGVGIGTVGAN